MRAAVRRGDEVAIGTGACCGGVPVAGKRRRRTDWRDPDPFDSTIMTHLNALRGVALPLVLPLVLLVAGSHAAPLLAQDEGPRTLEIADYRLWRSIDGETISPDGRWVAWSWAAVRMEDTLHVRRVDGSARHEVARGTDPRFSDDGAWVVFMRGPEIAERLELEREGEDVPMEAGLLSLASGETRYWSGVDDVEFAPGGSHLLIRRVQSDEEAEYDGVDVLLHDLRTGSEELLGSVKDAAFDDAGERLAYTVDAADLEGNGLYLIELETGARRTLDNARDHYTRLAWHDDGDRLAVLRGQTPDGREERDNTLVVMSDLDTTSPESREITAADGLAEDWVISNNTSLRWSTGGDVVFVGARPQAEELDDWGDDGLPLADVDIFHWQDDRIQTQQQRALSRDRNRTWMAAVHLDRGRIVPLADARMDQVSPTRDGRWAIGRDGTDYVSDWKPAYADWYRVDTRTGERTLILEAHERTLGLSPDSRHMAYWKDGNVWLYEIEADRHRNLTESAPVSFVNGEWDYFGERPPYGVAGWTADGRGVVLYDRYDLWLQPLDGSAARPLTGGRGAEGEMRLRVVDLDPDALDLDLDEPILLSAFGERTKDAGFFRLDGDRLTELTVEAKRFSYPQKAKDADDLLFTVQSWTDFPDLWVTGGDFADRTRITDANPQQADFHWGRRILFDYEVSGGIQLQGTLAIPDGWTEGDAPLPMIVRFYEKYSQNLHAYPTPMYRHQPNFAGYVSAGYLLMMPDVHFRLRTTHSDMLEAIEAATQKVIDLGYADPDRIGLSGHSFSGGGGAYIATRSEMFAAIAHGAAPINLVSEFNQLFVGTGANNHGYDTYGQGRYATNPYDDFELYWDQSPIAHVETMNTPVLYLHGEADPVVNWEQGLEWYNALRFLEKPVIWLSYPGEGHGLSRLENRIDFQHRLRHFFDHHLKGAPAPAWMTEGVTQLEKERHLREFAPRIFRSGGEGDAGGDAGGEG